MSSRGGSSNNGVGVQSIPAASRKMVQSLKEIVNCPEQEIYSMLKECNMDPNEAVNRLLTQDHFIEVKSKKEKKKENKDTTESRPRGVSSTSNRGGRGATDRYSGRSSSIQFGAFEYGKPAYKKENGTNAFTGSLSSVTGMAGSNTHLRPSVPSDSINYENKGSTTGILDGISSSSSSQSSSGYQTAWVGVPGQLSMADIVKRGRPHNKASIPNPSQPSVHNHHVQAPSFTAVQNDFPTFEGRGSKVSEMSSEPGVGEGQSIPPSDEWSSIEPPPDSTVPSVLDHPTDFELHADPSNLHYDRINQPHQSQADEMSEEEDGSVENLNVTHVDSDLHENIGSYQSHEHVFEYQEVVDVGGPVSSVAANLHQLSIREEDRGASATEDRPSVVIPDHLQVQNADCSHLSFGSFGSGNAAFSGPFASKASKSDLEEESVEADASSIGHSDTRNVEYYGEEPLRTSTDGNIVHIASANAGSYDSPSALQTEDLKQENPETAHANHYTFLPSTSGYTFENAQQLNTGPTNAHTNLQMQSLPPFSSVMLPYTNSLPSTLLEATAQPMRESDLPYSPFPTTQSMPTKYNHTASSISGSSISMPEALKAANFLSNQPTPQTLAGNSVATGPGLPQHLAVHPYSQAALPLGPFTNMIGYPFLPQSYTYMPSAFQQAFAGNSNYPQSLAAVLPQYKNSASISSLPQSANVASGYGAFGSSNSIPGNFPMNPPAAPSGTTIGYDDILNSQYKDSLISLQQNENSGMWVHGPGSRTMSAVPANTYYSFPGQNPQQPGGFRQGSQPPQPSQNYSSLGYPNFYHSQTGMSLEHQQQNPRDGALGGGSQGQQPSKQLPQIWQGNY